ncbi:hypothetical protein WDW37_13435 [Bdellovibrionota bacterium FG-1]
MKRIIIASALTTLTLSGCASVKSFLALNAYDNTPPPIHNPFDAYDSKTDSTDNIIMRTRKGERSMEVELPGGTSHLSELSIPVSSALQDTVARNPASVSPIEDPGANDPSAEGNESYVSALKHVQYLYKSRRFEAALIEIDHILKQYPTASKLHQMRGTLLDRIGQPQLALKSWRHALELDSGNVTLRRFVDSREQKRSLASP